MPYGTSITLVQSWTQQIRLSVVRPALQALEPHIPYSTVAEDLVMGTGMVESNYIELVQRGNGPARSFWQVEIATHDDNWRNFLRYRRGLARKIVSGWNWWNGIPPADRLVYDLRYAAQMCRVRYFRVPEPLPQGDARSLAAYWKEHYNTVHGAGQVEEFVMRYPMTGGGGGW